MSTPATPGPAAPLRRMTIDAVRSKLTARLVKERRQAVGEMFAYIRVLPAMER